MLRDLLLTLGPHTFFERTRAQLMLSIHITDRNVLQKDQKLISKSMIEKPHFSSFNFVKFDFEISNS